MPTISGEAIDFFVSRAGSDSAIAEQIAAMLEEMGFKVVLQQWDFRNRSFIERMHAALASTARMIALLSPDYLQSEYCAAEWQNVLATDPLNKRARLIVVKVRECNPIGLLSAISYWNIAATSGQPEAMRQLLRLATGPAAERVGRAPSEYWQAPAKVCHPLIRANPGFVGREQSLSALSIALAKPSGRPRMAGSIVAIHGLGGVGKSVLARELAWRSRDHYAGVWLVNGVSEERIVHGLIELGKRYF